MPECGLGIVVGRRQVWIGDKGSDGVPVIEDFAGERTRLGDIRVFVEKTGPFEAGQDGVERARAVLFCDGVDQPAKFAHEPLAEAGCVVVIAVDQGDAFADQMREAALARL